MKRMTKIGIIAGVLAVLALAFFFGGPRTAPSPQPADGTEKAVLQDVQGQAAADGGQSGSAPQDAAAPSMSPAPPADADTAGQPAGTGAAAEPGQGAVKAGGETEKEPASSPADRAGTSTAPSGNSSASAPEAAANRAQPAEPQQGASAPAQQEQAPVSDPTCTLAVTVKTLVGNSGLNPDKAGLVPESGAVFPASTVTFHVGETVFQVLQRTMKQNKIHLEFQNTPAFRSAYIEGIGNLYEFDCGPLSGWMYKVNGVFPGKGCSSYVLQDGDVVEWVYTCDLGRDVGGYGAAMGGA